MTDIIPKGTTGRYMGISNVATAVSGPVGRLTAGLISAGLVLIGLPADLRNVPNSGPQSVYYEIAPRVALIAALVFFAISGWALRHVDERRRED
jgi:hypothetical protein